MGVALVLIYPCGKAKPPPRRGQRAVRRVEQRSDLASERQLASRVALFVASTAVYLAFV